MKLSKAATVGGIIQVVSASSGYDVSRMDYTYIPESQRQHEMDVCDNLTNCGGIVFYPPDEFAEVDKNHQEIVDRDQDLGRQRMILDSKASIRNGTSVHEDDVENEGEGDDAVDDMHGLQGEVLVGMLRLLIVPEYYNAHHEDVFVSSKAWLVHRGAVQISTRDHQSSLLRTAEDMRIPDARAWCESHNSCIGFSFPLQSRKNAISDTVDRVVFVSEVKGFDYGASDTVQRSEEEEETLETQCGQVDWITHIINDRSRAPGRIVKHIDITEGNWRTHSTTPYRPCCDLPQNLPSIRDVEPLDTLERISCDISREEFYEKYESTRTPVMLVGCDDRWPAHNKWSDIPSLLDRFDNSSQWSAPHSTSWGDFAEYYRAKGEGEGDPFRVFHILEPGYQADEIHKDYSVPPAFDGADIYARLPTYKNDTFFPTTYDGPMHWFLIGSNGTGTGPHIDPHATDAWNTLLHGHKWWTIYPKRPNVITEGEAKCFKPCAAPGYNDGPINNNRGVSWYSSVGRHVHKMYYGEESVRHVMQKAGETIYVPFGMVHSVLNMDETIAVTQNYGAPGNFEEVWREILNSGQENDWKHMYYNELSRDLRQRARNVLWPVDEENRERIDGADMPYHALDSEELGDSEDHEEDSEDNGDHEEDRDDDYDDDDTITEEEYEALNDDEKAQYEVLLVESNTRSAMIATVQRS